MAEQLSLCVDEVKFVAEERPLLDDESCCLVVHILVGFRVPQKMEDGDITRDRWI